MLLKFFHVSQCISRTIPHTNFGGPIHVDKVEIEHIPWEVTIWQSRNHFYTITTLLRSILRFISHIHPRKCHISEFLICCTANVSKAVHSIYKSLGVTVHHGESCYQHLVIKPIQLHSFLNHHTMHYEIVLSRPSLVHRPYHNTTK